ncbi:hypothetical protein Tco_0750772 [Tanacetum coccineum]|uniref:Uncharacterized protein n=1 Tax=Tanacetum coccineum TaxID=301880 RepID=A0ABQ4Z398_9ASTR
MAKQGLHFSCHVTPLFPNMLAQAVVDEGEGSGQLTKPQPTPSPTQPSTGDQPRVTESSYRPDTTQDPRENLEGTYGSQGDHVQIPHDSPLSGGHSSDKAEGGLNLNELLVVCTNLSNRVLALETSKDAQAVEILNLKTRIKKLEKKCKPNISHHIAWLRSVSRLSRKKKLGKKESVSKQGRKNTKSGPKLDDSTFDELNADLAHGMDYMETEEAVNEGRQSNETEELNLDAEDKGSGEKGGSTVSTARPEVDTASTVDPEVIEKAKEKGVAFKDVEDTSRLVRSITTLKPLPSIDPKDKGNGILVEEEPVKIKRKDQGIDQIKRDEELAHKIHEEELAEIARIQEEKVAQEEAFRVAIMEMFDEVQAATQRKFRAAQRTTKIRSRPPTKSQLRNLMMTYLKNMGGYKHSQLKEKTFEEIQAMCKRQKKRIDDFKPIDSDDAIKDSKKVAGEDTSKKEEVLKEHNSTKIESMNKEDAGERVSDVSKKRKGGPRMKGMSKRKKTESDLEEEEDLKNFLVPDKEGIIDYEVLEKRFPIIN